MAESQNIMWYGTVNKCKIYSISISQTIDFIQPLKYMHSKE